MENWRQKQGVATLTRYHHPVVKDGRRERRWETKVIAYDLVGEREAQPTTRTVGTAEATASKGDAYPRIGLREASSSSSYAQTIYDVGRRGNLRFEEGTIFAVKGNDLGYQLQVRQRSVIGSRARPRQTKSCCCSVGGIRRHRGGGKESHRYSRLQSVTTAEKSKASEGVGRHQSVDSLQRLRARAAT